MADVRMWQRVTNVDAEEIRLLLIVLSHASGPSGVYNSVLIWGLWAPDVWALCFFCDWHVIRGVI